jgi:hypothetical protein
LGTGAGAAGVLAAVGAGAADGVEGAEAGAPDPQVELRTANRGARYLRPWDMERVVSLKRGRFAFVMPLDHFERRFGWEKLGL